VTNSKLTSPKVLLIQQMIVLTRKKIEERIDELGGKIELAYKNYLNTRDDKTIVEELYRLTRELEMLRKEIIRLEDRPRARDLVEVSDVSMPTGEEIAQKDG
jgi:hypothetical protein